MTIHTLRKELRHHRCQICLEKQLVTVGIDRVMMCQPCFVEANQLEMAYRTAMPYVPSESLMEKLDAEIFPDLRSKWEEAVRERHARTRANVEALIAAELKTLKKDGAAYIDEIRQTYKIRRAEDALEKLKRRKV